MQQTLIHRNLLKKDDLATLKSDIDDLEINKLKSVLVDLGKLSNAVNNGAVRKDGYNTDKKKIK